MEMSELLDELIQRKASDLHLAVGLPPVFRVAGALIRRESEPLTGASIQAILHPCLTPEELASLEERRHDVEKSLQRDGYRFRTNIFKERGNLAAALRLVPNHVPTLTELGMGEDKLPAITKLTRLPRGLVLFVGPTGSGKSTAVAALIEEINRDRAERILTIEDPIEYEFQNKKSMITQRAVGEDVASYPEALRSAMREDPDVILVGDTRDLETISLILALAETGHLVYSTLPVDTTSAAIQRLIDAFPDSHRPAIRRMLAQCLQAVVAQKLVPRNGPVGRVVVCEILIGTPRIRRMIAEGHTDFSVAIEAGRAIGMQTMDDHLIRLAQEGVISKEMAWSRMEDKSRIEISGADF